MISEAARASGTEWAARSNEQGVEVDAILAHLREIGFSPMDCIRVIMNISGSPLAEATRIVHFSRAWPELSA
ncbi:hypothetical protein [Peterkaempfera sp. SMS 1(5)a]|uniref:hypothetical protein n=1 Tax=Peterkaempfera podocarpi TaxID=3232308 RepID=UPI00366D9950